MTGLLDDLEGGLIVEPSLLGSPFHLQLEFIEPGVVVQPILEAAILPTRDVVVFEAGKTFSGEPVNDPLIFDAVIEHLVEFVADLFGETGDFAGASVFMAR